MDLKELALSRIYFEYRNAPKLADWISILPKIGNEYLEEPLEQLSDILDIDNATGWQLDIIGRIVGIDRYVKTDITDTFFSWDTDDLGWDEARWKDPNEPSTTSSKVGDEFYRVFIRLKIAINNWDGTFATIPTLFNTVLEDAGFDVDIIDNQDMTETIILTGGPLSNELVGAMKYEGLMLRCQGVGIKDFERPSDDDDGTTNDYIFAFDLENDIYKGLDEGAWSEEI